MRVLNFIFLYDKKTNKKITKVAMHLSGGEAKIFFSFFGGQGVCKVKDPLNLDKKGELKTQ